MTGPSSPRWLEYAQELGASIGRSSRPFSLLLGAGASISSGGPTTTTVHDHVLAATRARFAGMDVAQVIHQLPEREKQDILAPLFAHVSPNVGYVALATLATRRRIFVMNLNWDDALTQACAQVGATCVDFDILDRGSDWRSRWDDNGPALFNSHLHGCLGERCRYGRLETLVFPSEVSEHLLECALGNTLACVGASITAETDLPQLFAARARREDPTQPSASHWYFVRGDDALGGDDRQRLAQTSAHPYTYVKDPDLDFDRLAVVLVDAAIAEIVAHAGGARA